MASANPPPPPRSPALPLLPSLPLLHLLRLSVFVCVVREKLEIRIFTRSYAYSCIQFIISNKPRNPCIKIIISGSNVANGETSKTISPGPKLVALERYYVRCKVLS